MTKQQLRATLIARRRKLSLTEVGQKSQVILTRLMRAVDWKDIKHVHCYRAVSSEVQTKQFIEWAEGHGVKVTVPGQKAPEPTKAELTEKYDLIIVPTLGFDSSLHRLGQGGGYYDRLLAAQPQVKSVGLCFKDGLVAKGLPRETHDQKLDIIITEDRLYPG